MPEQDETRERYPDGLLNLHGIGRLTHDPEMRYTPSGKAVVNMNLAVNLRTKVNDAFGTATLWLRLTVWDQLAETCNRWLSKGSKVYFEGRLDFDPNTGGPVMFTRNDGTPGVRFEATASTVRFLGGGQNNGQGEPAEEQISFA
jgi:single-strand DNA-binding protein